MSNERETEGEREGGRKGGRERGRLAGEDKVGGKVIESGKINVVTRLC